jgi:hypothetical protein
VLKKSNKKRIYWILGITLFLLLYILSVGPIEILKYRFRLDNSVAGDCIEIVYFPINKATEYILIILIFGIQSFRYGKDCGGGPIASSDVHIVSAGLNRNDKTQQRTNTFTVFTVATGISRWNVLVFAGTPPLKPFSVDHLDKNVDW